MNAPSIFRQHRAARWLVPAGVISILGAAGCGVLDPSSRTAGLPSKSATQLVAEVRSAQHVGVSGTVVVELSTGASDLPELAAANDAPSFGALLHGSHTMRFWYGGPQRQRVALLGATDETDVFRDGRDVWQWSSADRTAAHSVLPDGAATAMPVSSLLPQQLATLMPQPLAAGAIAAIDADTTVTVADSRRIADRAAYQLVLTPGGTATRIGSVHITVDAATRVPLSVEIYARGKTKPVVDVAYASISFKHPSPGLFAFTPPPGAKVIESGALGTGKQAEPVAVLGKGWTAIVEYRVNPSWISAAAAPLVRVLEPVHGSWGKGRMLDATLLCVLVTDDGRVFAGAVEPSALYAAAARR